MRQYCFVFLFILFSFNLSAQNPKLISGPWSGNVELRSAAIWLEVDPQVKSIAVKYHPEGNISKLKTIQPNTELGKDFNPIKIVINALEPNTKYLYEIWIDNKLVKTDFPTTFTTKELWQYRKPAPNFRFLTGSCAYFNEPDFDRPGKPYGGDSSIFETMANTPAAFHLWLGDNWYTREVDYNSVWGLNYRASRDRSQKVLQKFMAAMPQYAIWDDHDFGPNDAGKSYILKEESRKVFQAYSLNPSYGENNQGIYTQFSYGDVDFFLTDDRYFRSEPELEDSTDGKPNLQKTFFGEAQLNWLENALLASKAKFKIIAVGNQVLNQFNKYESLKEYPAEYNRLLDFLDHYKISGVVFLSGDRHHSEIISMKRKSYPLYDITVSPYTSGVSKVSGAELNNPDRIAGTLIEDQNFASISIKTENKQRILKVDFIGLHGETLGTWSVSEQSLNYTETSN
jgi:alkaline phosphatase D